MEYDTDEYKKLKKKVLRKLYERRMYRDSPEWRARKSRTAKEYYKRKLIKLYKQQ